MHWLAAAVLADVLEARQVTDGWLHVGRAEHQVRGFHRCRGELRRRIQDAGHHLGVVGLQRAGDAAQQGQRQRLVHRAAGGAAGIERIGDAAQCTVAHHFADQADTLTGLLLHFARHVVLVQVGGLVGHRIQAGILLERAGDVGRSQRVRAGGHTFSRQVVRGERGHVRAGDPLVVGAAERQPTAKDDVVALVLGHLALHASNAQNFHGHRVGEDFALQFVDTRGLRVECLDSHFGFL